MHRRCDSLVGLRPRVGVNAVQNPIQPNGAVGASLRGVRGAAIDSEADTGHRTGSEQGNQCLRGCRCHLHPITRGISMLEGANGSLGLHKYHVCYCCEPWTWQELDGFVKDLAAIAAMTTIEGLLS
jgi:hypothetical protein